MRRLAVLALLTVALVACGDGDDTKQIRATFAALERALHRGDFAAVCGLMTERAQREQIKVAANPDAGSCQASWEPASIALSEEDGFQTVQGFIAVPPRIAVVEVDGDRAVVRHTSGPPSAMRKRNGRWLID